MSNPETLRGLIQHLRESTYWANSCPSLPHDPHFDAKNEGIREACDYLESEIADCTLDSPIIKRESKTCFDCDRYTTNYGCVRKGGTRYFCNPKDIACTLFKPVSE